MTSKVVAVCVVSAALAGCAIPNSGPGTDEVLSQARASTGSAVHQRYEFVDITQAVVDVLGRRPPNSLRSSFGDYRPPVEPRIGVGDTVSVTIWEAAAGGLFSSALTTDRFSTGSKSATIPDQAVSRDGSIMVPYAGRIAVIGKTTHQVEDEVVAALAGKAIQPQALVTISRSVSNAVTVTGEVNGGARVPLSIRGDRILDVIATAGGLRSAVPDLFVRLSRGGRTVSVPLQHVVSDPRENIYMRPDDVLTLVKDPQSFMATGASGRNEEIPFDADGITLSQALAKAGGLADYRADPTGVFLFRYEPDSIASALAPNSPLVGAHRAVPIVYRLNMKDANSIFLAQHFPVFDKDVIYISNASITDLQKVMQVFNTLATPVSVASGVASAAR